MSDDNGKQNGKKKLHPNSLANLKPFKKGESGYAGAPKKRKLTFMDHLRYALDEQIRGADGNLISANEALARLLVRRALHSAGFDKAGLPKPWCKSIDHILARVAPPQRDDIIEVETTNAIIAQVNDHQVSVAFIENVRQFTGRQKITSDDILEFIDNDINASIEP